MRRARESLTAYGSAPVLCDVSVLVAASRPDHTFHAQARGALDALAAQDGALAWSDQIQAAVLRITTNPRVFAQPTTPAEAFAQAERILAYPNLVRVSPGPDHWRIFRELVLATGLSGGDTSDAWHAALAIGNGCAFWTLDRDFARFPGLRWRNLLDGGQPA